MGSIDWKSEPGGLAVDAGGGLIEATGAAALAAAFAHDLEQPLGSMPWDAAGTGMEAEIEGSRLFGLFGLDLHEGVVRAVRREIRRVARTPRWRDAIDAVEVVSLDAAADRLTIGIEIVADGEAAAAAATIGG